MSEIEGARGAFESWLRRENGKWADKITERHADGRYCTLQAYMDWGAFQAGWLAALTSIDHEAIRAEARTEYRVELDAYIRTLRNFRDNWDCDEDAHAHGTTCRACEAADVLSHFARAAILADEPKKREPDEPGIDDVVAYVFADGTVTLDKWDGTRQYNGNLVVLMRRAEVERKLKEAEV